MIKFIKKKIKTNKKRFKIFFWPLFTSVFWFGLSRWKDAPTVFLWLFISKLINSHRECHFAAGKIRIMLNNSFHISLKYQKTFLIFFGLVAFTMVSLYGVFVRVKEEKVSISHHKIDSNIMTIHLINGPKFFRI